MCVVVMVSGYETEDSNNDGEKVTWVFWSGFTSND